jgi:GT2 family glycosyltransferase
MNAEKVAVVILNWKKPADTLACLAEFGENTAVVVVDNGSGDGSVEQIREARPDVPVLALEENLGYAGGNNAGIAWALARDFEWILLINEDAILPVEALQALFEAAQNDPRVGFAGPLVLHPQPDNRIQSAGGLFDRRWQATHRGQNQVDTGQYSRIEEVAWLSGCVLLARSQMIREIGMLDERFFLYQEELEWCLRARQRGWKALFVPQAKATHAGVSANYEPKPYVTYYMTRNRFLLLAKLRAGWLIWLDAIFQTTRTFFSWTLRPKWRGKRAHRDAIWQAVVDSVRRRWGPMRPSPKVG